jgi:hypothetical protein
VLFPAPEGPSIAMVNLLTLRPVGGGLFKVTPDRFFFSLPSSAGFGAAERVNIFLLVIFSTPAPKPIFI